MKKALLAPSIVFLFAAFANQQALAWGQFGHEEINHTATRLLGTDNAIGSCLNDATYSVRRMAITPDVEWKTDMSLKTITPEVKHQRMLNDQYEHSLHFFEADAFVSQNNAVQETAILPAGEYAAISKIYQTRLAQNIDYVVMVDPSKSIKDPKNPTVNEVTAHGTAPWRVLQLYRLSVDALKAGNTQLAIMYLSTMGHYVGDLSQPFHTTLNYDGAYPASNGTAGIHHEIDTGLLPGDGKDAMEVFSDSAFDSTIEGDVLARAKNILSNEAPKNLQQAEIVPALLQMVSTGAAEVPVLLSAYKQQCDLRNASPSGKLAALPAPQYCVAIQTGKQARVRGIGKAQEKALDLFTVKLTLPENEESETVAQLIDERLAQSAAILARLWVSAYHDAGSPELSGCDKFNSFDESTREFVVKNYPRPNDASMHGYMPAGYVIERPHTSQNPVNSSNADSSEQGN